MASPMVQKIKKTTDQVWPEVSAALASTTLRILEIAGIAEAAITQVEEYVSNHDRGHWKRRQIASETVWALARQGHLRVGPEREIVQAAQELVHLLRGVPTDELEPEESNLIKAVDSLPSWE